MTKIPEIIIHYQKSINKCGHDKNRLLHCILKLDNLPITVQHLQETGIGRTVNSLRKDDGDVGYAAKDLVNKWKDLVAAEESGEDGGAVGENEGGRNSGSGGESTSTVTKTGMEDENQHGNDDDDEDKINIKKLKSYSHKNSSSSTNSTHKSHNHHKSSNEHLKKVKEEKLTTPHHGKSSSSTSNNKEHRSKDHERNKHHHHKSSSSTKTSSSSSNNGHNSNNNHQHIKTEPIGENELKRRHIKTESIDESELKRSHIKTESIDESELKRRHIKTELIDENELKKENRHHHNSKDDSTSKHLKNSSSGSRKHSSNKHSTSASSSSSSSRSHNSSNYNEIDSQRIKKESHHQNEEVKSKDRSITKDIEKEHKSRSERSSTSRHDDDNNDRKKQHHLHKRSSSPSSSVSPPPTIQIKKPKSESSDQIDEIDSTMGTSFAEALGMMIPSSSSKKQKSSQKIDQVPVIPTLRTNIHIPATVSSSSDGASSSGSIKKEKKTLSIASSSATPALLKSSIHLAPLEPELALEIPTISNNYRPAPLNSIVMDCVYKQQQQQQSNQIAIQQQMAQPVKRFMTDEELGASMSSKTMRTKVYSGVKSAISNCLKLKELCIRVLQKNIDALEYTGGVPFDILKPVFERASAQQLQILEEYNPYLIEDTNELWEFHCKRKFRSQKRMEMESWREMFVRCTDEQAARLSSLTENIKLSQTVAVPVKQTKIAYVDSMVKPPRDIIKRQNKFGTERILVSTPAARVATLNNTTANVAKVGDVRLRVAAGLRDNAQVGASSSSAFRPKKAPLMAKTLQLMKGRFKR